MMGDNMGWAWAIVALITIALLVLVGCAIASWVRPTTKPADTPEAQRAAQPEPAPEHPNCLCAGETAMYAGRVLREAEEIAAWAWRNWQPVKEKES